MPSPESVILVSAAVAVGGISETGLVVLAVVTARVVARVVSGILSGGAAVTDGVSGFTGFVIAVATEVTI